ncbi:HAD-IA family hydrolase [Asticcacaulis sp. AC402]|uniref:HAD-IA family hydrolase n=1 Tax=Asticcacaulis sp. AC402 TaxID=1282361 RepID=UPI0003C3D03D|nr:HAD-IA family hydrolase [Asticcacaulis sp. AC402]ESQ74601.1 haloacid dehalogenase [Asticcacaulis sp. AC402]
MAVFDVDGTLVDSRSSIFRAATEAAEATGLTPPSYDQVRAIVGISLFEAIVHMLPDHDEATHRAYLEAFQASYVRMHENSQFCEALYAGADDLLRRLKSDGWFLGMATGQSRRGVNRCLDSYDWHDLFNVTFCADDGPSKPHPHMLQANLKALGLDPHQAVMIGDTGHDMRMAREARVHFIGVSWGFHTVEEMEQADHIVHDFNELTAALGAFSKVVSHG